MYQKNQYFLSQRSKYFMKRRNTINESLIDMCKIGNIEIASKLIEQGADIYFKMEKAFFVACTKGHLPLAQYLYLLSVEKGKPFSLNSLRQVFTEACLQGKLDVVAWLYEESQRKNVQLKNFDTICFYKCCRKNHLSICQWLYQNGDFTIFSHSMSPIAIDTFLICCHSGYLEMIQWLHDLAPFNVEQIIENNTSLLPGVYQCGYVDLYFWLVGFIPYSDRKNMPILTNRQCRSMLESNEETVKKLFLKQSNLSELPADSECIICCQSMNSPLIETSKGSLIRFHCHPTHIFHLQCAAQLKDNYCPYRCYNVGNILDHTLLG